jgi:hypothetical protein
MTVPSVFLKPTTRNTTMDMTKSSIRPNRVEVVTSGRVSTRGSLPMSSNGSRILRPRTASSSACMPSLLWRIRRSGMFYRESCSAGSKESGGHGDGSRPSNLQVQSLQDRGFFAVGVLQIHSGLGGQGRASD